VSHAGVWHSHACVCCEVECGERAGNQQCKLPTTTCIRTYGSTHRHKTLRLEPMPDRAISRSTDSLPAVVGAAANSVHYARNKACFESIGVQSSMRNKRDTCCRPAQRQVLLVAYEQSRSCIAVQCKHVQRRNVAHAKHKLCDIAQSSTAQAQPKSVQPQTWLQDSRTCRTA
jgi:hypothetical protein